MHRIESDNVDITAGKNQFKDGPPGTTVNAAIMNAMQEEICNAIVGGGLTLKTKLTDTHDQLNSVIQNLAYKNGRSATYIFASSDSESKSQGGADQIISTSADAAAIIKAKAAELSALNGGLILCLEGTYNCYTELDWSSFVDLIGCGYRTVFKRQAGITYVIDSSAVENCLFSNFRINGNKGIFPGAYTGIIGKTASYTSEYERIISHNNGANGFLNCNQLSNCYSYSNTTYGFSNCKQSSNCYSYSNTLDGLINCYQLSNCYSYSNLNSGFLYCNQLSNCYSYLNGSRGFTACNQLSNCYAQKNSSSGFVLCKQLVACKSISNAVSQYHYTSCWPMQQCVGASGGSAWRSCFADHAGTSAVADTAAGGYNYA